MRHSILVLTAIAVVLFAACAEDAPTVRTTGAALLADAGYYPTLPDSRWEYRIDSTRGGVTQTGAAIVRARTIGVFANDSVEYRIQVNEIIRGTAVEYDTLYARKAEEGVRLSSPGLQTFSNLPNLPGLQIGEIPRDFLVVPYTSFLGTWDILSIEFNQIPLLSIYFRVKGRNLGIADARTDLRTFRQCARVQLIVEAQFPNPQNPTDFLNPVRLNETADFYFTRPQGLVLAEGSAAIFRLLRGDIPLDRSYARVRQEVTAMDIAQPDPFCVK
ncbi:MAG: hypothetical protein RBU27_11385 [Bacteroidota bacterium]|jgi:hypothetical protein|nr:hypothetical protein [Bacteroidota bacterium]